MGIIPERTGNYSIEKSDIIFAEGQDAISVNILLKGMTEIFISSDENLSDLSHEDILKRSYRLFCAGQNIFIGTSDLFLSGRYSFTYKASDDSSMYMIVTRNIEEIKALLESQKDYSAYIIASISNLLNHSHTALKKIESITKMLNMITDNLAIHFWTMKEQLGFSFTPSGSSFRAGLERLEIMKEKGFECPPDVDAGFFEKNYTHLYDEEYEEATDTKLEKLEYYKHLSSIGLELRKSFFGADFFVTSYHCTDAAECLDYLQQRLKEAFQDFEKYFSLLYSESEECIFSYYISALSELKKSGEDSPQMNQAIDYIAKKVRETATLFEKDYCRKLEVDFAYMDSSINHAKSAAKAHGEKKEEANNIPAELKDSAKKILEYSEISKDKADLFLKNLYAFRKLKDKLSSDDETKNIRNTIASLFFEIYGAVAKKVVAENNESRLLNMFLNYAYMDEQLLHPEHILTLYRLAGRMAPNGKYPVYNMREWSSMIYSMERDPSINEFAQDYFDVFREMKKRSQVTEKDKAAYDNDVDGRLAFEINNMIKSNQKLCSGQISVYFPILHNDMITRELSKALVTSDMIKERIEKILSVDYSAFHREINYRNPEKGIEKELIMKQVFPDFILMPTFGSRAIMWQEISGRNRSTPGRFIIPVFTGENLDDLIIKLMGNFRWELCRTMMGVAWNDITLKSLTSEYTDYVQFFKKNSDLSEEAKEKLKVQIQKYRNMTRDIFTADYETWINFESNGVMRLNKVVRGILYRHCPFSRPIRENLEKQPAFSDFAMQFKNQRAKQAREYESHYNKLVKAGYSMEPEYEENLKFYKEQ